MMKRVVVVRDTTERPETQESGSAIVAGRNTESIKLAVEAALLLDPGTVPEGYTEPRVSDKVAKILLSNYRRT